MDKECTKAIVAELRAVVTLLPSQPLRYTEECAPDACIYTGPDYRVAEFYGDSGQDLAKFTVNASRLLPKILELLQKESFD